MIDPNLPLIDLHRHLEGNVRLETILDQGRRHNLKLPAPHVEGLRPYIQITDPQPGVMEFIAKFYWMMAVLVDYDACQRLLSKTLKMQRMKGSITLSCASAPFLWLLAMV